jgi:hypothetical protein
MKALVDRLGIKPNSRVCLIRPNPEVVAALRESGMPVSLVDGVDGGCDIILYWAVSQEGIGRELEILRHRIGHSGRIWVIIPKKEAAEKRGATLDWSVIQKQILEETDLVDNKVASIGEEEYGTQFVIRRSFMENSAHIKK